MSDVVGGDNDVDDSVEDDDDDDVYTGNCDSGPTRRGLRGRRIRVR